MNCNATQKVDDRTCKHEADCLKGLAVQPPAEGGRMMVALVSVETVLLVLLVVLVAGLLRSHAEIMRRLGPAEERLAACRGRCGRSRSARLRESVDAPELAGVTPDGDAVKLAFEGRARRRRCLRS